jgi:hypothetical protein
VHTVHPRLIGFGSALDAIVHAAIAWFAVGAPIRVQEAKQRGVDSPGFTSNTMPSIVV